MSWFDWLRSRPKKATATKSRDERKATAGYRPGTPISQFTQYDNQLPPLWLFFAQLEMMLVHDQVNISLDYYKSGLASAEFQVIAKRAEVAAFVQEIYERFWSTSLDEAQQSYHYGWIGAEILYREDDDGRLTFDSILAVHPRDAKPLSRDRILSAVRIDRASADGKPVDLAISDGKSIGKGFWHAHRANYGSLFGISQLFAAWRPWRRLAFRNGGEDIIDLSVYRYGVLGPVGYFPPGKPNVDETGRESTDPSNQDTMLALVELYKAGGGITMPSTRDEHGQRIWDMNLPDRVLNVDSLINYTKDLERKISLAIGVPPELLQAAETGSGYSGRQIPLEAFYEGQMKVGRRFIKTIREQIAKPLVKLNFGEDGTDFDVDLESLLLTRAKRQMVSGGGGNGGQVNAITGLPNGAIRSTATPFLGLSTNYREEDHPRNEDGEWASKMSLNEWDQHLRRKGRRAEYGPGIGQLKLAHRGHVEDALKAGNVIPKEVRAEYPDLNEKYPVKLNKLKREYDPNKGRETKLAKKLERDKLAAEAAEQGINPDHVHQLAKEIRDRDWEHKFQHNAMLKRARLGLDKYGGAHRMIAAKSAKGGKGQVEDWVKGLDDVARTVAGEFPGFFGRDTGYHGDASFDLGEESADTSQRLLDYLREGNQFPLSDEEAYGQALAQLVEYKDAGQYDPGQEELPDFDVDLTVHPWEMTQSEFLQQRKATAARANKAHYRAGFIGKAQPDRQNSREERMKLAEAAGYVPGSTEFADVVTKWPLHRLHVAAAVKAGKNVPQHVREEYRHLTFLSTGLHKFSSTQFNILDAGYPRSQGSPFEPLCRLAAMIDDADLVGDGRELEPHITVKYGLHTDDAKSIHNVVDGFGSVNIRLGKTSIFPADESESQRGGDAYDVVKVDVESDDLRRLNELISQSLDHSDKFTVYQPHITLAYVRPGAGAKYVGNGAVDGCEIMCRRLIFSNQEGSRTTIDLIPKLTFLATGGDEDVTINRPLPADADINKWIALSNQSLDYLQSQLVRQVLATLGDKPTAETWEAVRALLNQYRTDSAHALAIARIGAALSAMQRVAQIAPLFTPRGIQGSVEPPAPSQPTASIIQDALGIVQGQTPVVSLTQIEEAVKDLSSRKVMSPESFAKLVSEARDSAFTLAGSLPQADLTVVRDTLAKAVDQGLDQRQWHQQVVAELGRDPFMSPSHRETVFRANVFSAYTNGANQVLADPMVGEHFPYRQIFEIEDARGRPWHAALNHYGLDGTNIYRADDPIWQIICPPSDFGCRGGWAPATVAQAARAGVREAQEWQASGVEPTNPGRATLPPNWRQSPVWQR